MSLQMNRVKLKASSAEHLLSHMHKPEDDLITVEDVQSKLDSTTLPSAVKKLQLALKVRKARR